jgi:hypothetical protein
MSPFALTSPGGQIVNLNLSAGVSFLFGGTAFVLTPAGTLNANFISGTFPRLASFQAVHQDPSNPEGLSISQGAELTVVGQSLPPVPFAGPLADDSQVIVPVGCIHAFGRNFSNFSIQSNGRIMFGGGNTYANPSVSQFQTDVPSFGAWSDLDPSAGGLIYMSSPAPGVLSVNYLFVPNYLSTTQNSFSLQIDTNTGVLSIVGLGGIALEFLPQLIGASPGTPGATDPGPVLFSPSTLGVTTNATDTIYNMGGQGFLTLGISRIDFTPNGFNNYDWISY